MAVRYDTGTYSSSKTLTNGFLRADAYLTRPGVFEYRCGDGSIRRELRLPEEVFREDSIATLAMVPLTLEHSGGLLTAGNAREHTVGHVGDQIERADSLLRGRIMITDEAAVRAVESGEKRELSCGYECDLEETPGTWEGQRYDAVQRRIRYNHVAITKHGRAGPEVRIRMDSETAVMVSADSADAPATQQPRHDGDKGPAMAMLRLDGVDYDAPDQLAQAVTASRTKLDKEVEDLRVKLDSQSKELDTLKARADSLDEELGKERKLREDAESPGRVRALVDERVSLERTAADVLGSEVKLDSMDNAAIKRAVVTKVSPEAKLDGVSEAYLQGRFDHAVEVTRANTGLGDLRRAATTPASTTRCDSDDARKRFLERSATSWQRKES